MLPADLLCTPLAALQYSCMCLQVCTHELHVAGCSCRCAGLQVIWGSLQGLH